MRGDSHLKETAAISSFRLDEEDFGVENAFFMIPKRSFCQDRLGTNIWKSCEQECVSAGVIGERMAAPYAMPPTGDVYSYER
jgi:hypothetical protein